MRMCLRFFFYIFEVVQTMPIEFSFSVDKNIHIAHKSISITTTTTHTTKIIKQDRLDRVSNYRIFSFHSENHLQYALRFWLWPFLLFKYDKFSIGGGGGGGVGANINCSYNWRTSLKKRRRKKLQDSFDLRNFFKSNANDFLLKEKTNKQKKIAWFSLLYTSEANVFAPFDSYMLFHFDFIFIFT